MNQLKKNTSGGSAAGGGLNFQSCVTAIVCVHIARGILMCQHFTGHMVKQLFAAIRNQRATDSHWLNVVAHGYKTLQYIQTLPA